MNAASPVTYKSTMIRPRLQFSIKSNEN